VLLCLNKPAGGRRFCGEISLPGPDCGAEFHRGKFCSRKELYRRESCSLKADQRSCIGFQQKFRVARIVTNEGNHTLVVSAYSIPDLMVIVMSVPDKAARQSNMQT